MLLGATLGHALITWRLSVKVGDMVVFIHERPFSEPYFIIYKTYREKKISVVFLVSEHGKIGAFNPKELRVVSEGG